MKLFFERRMSLLLLIISSFLLILGFQNCTNQKNMALKIVEGSGLGLQLTSTSPHDLDETASLIPVKLKISSAVESFTESMITIENGTISDLSGENNEFSFNVIPKSFGPIKVLVAKGSCKKKNSSIPCGESNTLEFYVGNTPPTVTLSGISKSDVVSDQFQLKVLFSKKYFLNDLGPSKFDVTNGTLQNLTLNSDNPCECEYLLTVVPKGQPKDTISIQFKENIFFNKWGVGNLASNKYSVLFDAVVPEVMLSSQASDEVYGTFEVKLISTIPIPLQTQLTQNSLTISGGELIKIKDVDTFQKILEIKPTGANSISLSLNANVIINQWNMGNTPSNTITRTYTDSTFNILNPIPLITLNANNVHSYALNGQCPYVGKDVKIYIYKPQRTFVSSVTCDQNINSGNKEFKFLSVDFGNDLIVGNYPVAIETTDLNSALIKKDYSLTMAPSIDPNILTTPNAVFFKDVITSLSASRIYSNEVYITGLSTNVQLNLSFDLPSSTDLDAKFKVMRNGVLVNGVESSSVQVQNGDVVQASMVLINKTHGQINSVNINIGNSFTTIWKVKYHHPDAQALIFVSSQKVASKNHLNGSISLADTYCNNMAVAAGFKPNKPIWKALIAESGKSLSDKLPWAWSKIYRTDGALVASSMSQLLEGHLNNPINRMENGVLSPTTMVALGFADNKGSIGTSLQGAAATKLEDNTSCTFWTSGGGPGIGGSVSVGDPSSTQATKWFYNGIPYLSTCWDSPQPMYCVSDTNSELFDTPTGIQFKPMGTQLPNARVTSNANLIKGITKAVAVSLVGTAGNPKLSINGGAELDSAMLSNGDQLRVHLNTPTTLGGINTVNIKIGVDTYSWKVTYIDPQSTARIFVSSVSGYNTAFSPSGVLTADYTCSQLATNANLGGEWQAILSNPTTHAIDRISINWSKLTLVDGTQVASSLYQLFGGTLDHAINKDENGNDLSQDPYRTVMTGTLAHGLKGNDICVNGGLINVGDVNAVDGGWTNVNSVACYSIETRSHPRIYCLEKK